MISPFGNKLSSLKFEDKDIEKVYFEDKIVYRKNNKIYTPVTAIVASNKEQWVDTGLGKGWWSHLIEYEGKAMFTKQIASMFGQRESIAGYGYDMNCADTGEFIHRPRLDVNSPQYTVVVPNQLNSIHIIKYNLKEGFSVDDKFNKNIDADSFQLKNTFHVFRINQYADTSSSFNDNGIRTIYYLKMWYYGKLVIDYIPVLDENGVPCFFDKVTQKFFYSAGPKPLEYIE